MVVGQGRHVEALDDVAVHHALVGYSGFVERVAEGGVDGAKVVPDGEELLLELRGLLDGEVVEELADGGFLRRGEEAVVVEVAELLQVAQQTVGIGHVLVDVVEVANQQLAPEEEFVERLVAAGLLLVDLIEQARQAQRVANGVWRQALKQFADAAVDGRPQRRAASLACQVLVEEQAGTLVGEDHSRTAQVVTQTAVEVARYKLQKCLHISIIIVC